MAKLKLSIIKKLLRAFKEGATVGSACKIAGIARVTYYDWINRQWPGLAQHIEDVKVTARVEAVEDALYKSAVEGDVQAQKNFLLNRKRSWRLGDPRDNKPSVIVQNTVTQNNTPTQKVDDEEELRKNADLIGKFALVDRYGSKTGEGAVS